MSPIQQTPSNIFSKKDEIVSREIAGETILVPIRGKLADMQNIFSLNPAAKYIWELLDGKLTLEEITRGVMNSFGIERQQAEDDVYEFIDELLNAELIVREN